MKKEKNWSQIEYEYAYRQMRRGHTFGGIYAGDEIAMCHVKAADYSYREKEYVNAGWTNQPRKFKFYDLMATRYPTLWFIF